MKNGSYRASLGFQEQKGIVNRTGMKNIQDVSM